MRVHRRDDGPLHGHWRSKTANRRESTPSPHARSETALQGPVRASGDALTLWGAAAAPTQMSVEGCTLAFAAMERA